MTTPAPAVQDSQQHIAVVEPAVAAAASVPFAALASADGGAALNKTLEECGFAIVTDVIDDAGRGECERLWSADLKATIDVDASSDKKAAQAMLAAPNLAKSFDTAAYPVGRSSASDFGLPQGQLAWHVRRHPNLQRVFRAIFPEADAQPGDDGNPLCVGADCVFYSTKALPGNTDYATLTDLMWPHTDLNTYNKPSGTWRVVQGVQYVWPSDHSTSTTVVWPKSSSKDTTEPPRSRPREARMSSTSKVEA